MAAMNQRSFFFRSCEIGVELESQVMAVIDPWNPGRGSSGSFAVVSLIRELPR